MKSSGRGKRRNLRWDRSRWQAKTGAVLLPLAVMAALIVITRKADRVLRFDDIEIMTVEEAEPPPEPQPEEPEELEPAETPAESVGEVAVECAELPGPEALAPVPAFEPLPAPERLPSVDAVAMIRSPVTLKTLAGAARGSAGRSASIARFGGNAAAEAAVLRALRWLKTRQLADGSWKAKGEGDATAFALLAFLSHGEDFNSPEFGGCVRAAVKYLVAHHGNGMSVYALAEAAAVVKTPVLREIAEEAVGELCARQRERIRANSGGLLQRYCAVMAVASARMTKLAAPGLGTAREAFLAAFTEMRDGKAADFTKIRGEGAWRYMIAAVCLQYLGEGGAPSTRAMVKRLDAIWPAATLGESEIACCPVRSNYFSTMMFFNGGGRVWEKWNEGMLAAYTSSQLIEKDVYTDQDGVRRDIGSWRCRDQHIGDQPFWPTCYIAHQLMIYYRYLPTYSEESWSGSTSRPPPPERMDVDIEVDI